MVDFNWTAPIGNLTTGGFQENPCQELLDKQTSALGGIYDTYHTFLLMLIVYFIGSELIDKMIYASSIGKFKIIGKELDFHMSEGTIKILKSVKNIAMFVLLARTLIYYLLGSNY